MNRRYSHLYGRPVLQDVGADVKTLVIVREAGVDFPFVRRYGLTRPNARWAEAAKEIIQACLLKAIRSTHSTPFFLAFLMEIHR